jgi:hypothetical protein
MADLAEQKRQEYRMHAPVFHRPKENAREVHEPFLASLVADEEKITLVHEDPSGSVDGFLVAVLVPAPPVYEPGGLTCLVDDFMVAHRRLWATAGAALLAEATAQAVQRGAVQSVVVCGPQDEPKRKMLLGSGHIVASKWFTRPFAEQRNVGPLHRPPAGGVQRGTRRVRLGAGCAWPPRDVALGSIA